MKRDMNQSNLLLLLNAGPIEGSLKFALMVFLIQKRKPSLFTYKYSRGVKSPFSEEFYEDLKSLTTNNLVKVQWKKEGFPKRVYSLLDPNPAKSLEQEYFKLNFMTENELLFKVYREFHLSQYEIGDRIP